MKSVAKNIPLAFSLCTHRLLAGMLLLAHAQTASPEKVYRVALAEMAPAPSQPQAPAAVEPPPPPPPPAPEVPKPDVKKISPKKSDMPSAFPQNGLATPLPLPVLPYPKSETACQKLHKSGAKPPLF